MVAKSDNATQRVRIQVDANRTGLIVDSVNPSKSAMAKISKQQLRYDNSGIQPVIITVNNRPVIEQYDTINLVDSYLGISGQYIAFDVQKTMNMTNGQFRMTLQLNSI